MNRFKVYKLGSKYFFWNGKLIIGNCNKIFRGGYDITFGFVNFLRLFTFRFVYDKDITTQKNKARTLNTIKYVYKDILKKNGIICLTSYSFNEDRFKFDSILFEQIISKNKDFIGIGKDVHKFSFTNVISKVDSVDEVKLGLSKQDWFMGKEKNIQIIETDNEELSLSVSII